MRRRLLFWNHSDCHPLDCEHVSETHGHCQDCRHRQEDICSLTRAPLPSVAGCCHWNVIQAQGRQTVTREMLALLGLSLEETEEFVLRRLDVPYHLGPHGEVIVDIDDLAIPFSFGQGTEHLPEEELDWSAWFGRWCLQEA